MYEVKKPEWIRDDIEQCKKRIEEIRGKEGNATEMYKLINDINTGINLLHEGDVMEQLSKTDRSDYHSYISQLQQYLLNIKWDIKGTVETKEDKTMSEKSWKIGDVAILNTAVGIGINNLSVGTAVVICDIISDDLYEIRQSTLGIKGMCDPLWLDKPVRPFDQVFNASATAVHIRAEKDMGIVKGYRHDIDTIESIIRQLNNPEAGDCIRVSGGDTWLKINLSNEPPERAGLFKKLLIDILENQKLVIKEKADALQKQYSTIEKILAGGGDE